MKYFLIGNETGAPIYFDHPNGRMLIPPLSLMQEVIEEGFDERATCMIADGGPGNAGSTVKLVTHKWQGYVLCVVSDQGEHEIFLRSQLYSIFRLLQMFFGPLALQKKQSPFFLKHKRQLQNLIDLNSHYFTNNQSFLVHAAENVDLNRDLLKQCETELAKVLKSLPTSSHAVLYVGAKILATFHVPEYHDLNPQDVFLLLLYAQAEFHPLERAVDVDDVPVADYSDHADAARKAHLEAVTAASSPMALSVEDKKFDVMALLPHDEGSALPPIDETSSDSTSSGSGAGGGSGGGATVFSLESEMEEIIAETAAAAAAAAGQPTQPSAAAPAAVAAKKAPTVKNLFLRVQTVKGSAPGVGVSPDDVYTECRVFMAELHPSLHLVVVSSARKDPDEESKLNRAEGYLKSRKSLGPYYEFFVTKEATHVSMLSYCHQFPGLVHFILVDRTHHRVIAPSINPLFGQKFSGKSDELAQTHRTLLSQHVWKMTSVAQKHLSQGYTTSLVKDTEFQYYYEMFFEDADNVRVPLPPNVPLSVFENLALDSNCYTALLNKVFSNPKPRCYELYAMYLGALPSATVARYNTMLLAALRTQFPSYFGATKQ